MRARLNRLATRVPRRPPGRLPGPFRLPFGVGQGLLLDGRHVPFGHIQGYQLFRGLVEPAVQEALRRTLPPGGCFWDVGANLGFFTVLAGRLVGPQGAVEAIEPVPANARAVRDHARLNGMEDRVRVHELAAGAAPGRAELLVVDEASWSHLADRGWHARTEAVVPVEVAALGTLGLRDPDVVKIDVEGSELSVLVGMREVLERARPACIVELHETNAEVCSFFEELGWTVENLDGPEPVRAAGAVHLLARAR